mmetsp:Transcript_13892/g.21022  ORF Transcript_13892/g.21022 Transcript_13892/m.21022 type:complete len:203 (-) Transcript_13892:76-684(-)
MEQYQFESPTHSKLPSSSPTAAEKYRKLKKKNKLKKTGPEALKTLWNSIMDNDEKLFTKILNASVLDEELECGRTGLMWCAFLNRRDMLSHFIEAGANLDAQNYMGCTALHFAAKEGHSGITTLLLSKGADPTIEDIENQLPQEVANKPEIVHLLNQAVRLRDASSRAEELAIQQEYALKRKQYESENAPKSQLHGNIFITQ